MKTLKTTIYEGLLAGQDATLDRGQEDLDAMTIQDIEKKLLDANRYYIHNPNKMLKDYEFLKKFFKVAFPVMLHALLLFIVNFIDNIMVGSVSNEAISGVFAANQATYILMIAAYSILNISIPI